MEKFNFRPIFRTTTLKDIFRNMQQNKVERDPSENQRNDQYMVEEDSEYRELFEEGDVTGFMSHKPLPSSSETNHYNSNVSGCMIEKFIMLTNGNFSSFFNVILKLCRVTDSSWSQAR